MLQALGLPAGFEDVATYPVRSNTRQRDVEAHATAWNRPPEHSPYRLQLLMPGAMLESVQLPLPPAGLVEVATSPPIPAATQSAGEGHETAVSPLGLGTDVVLQADAPPVGLVEVSTEEYWSTATHNELDGHDSEPIPAPPGSRAAVHVEAPPAGSVEVSTTPGPPATHSDVDGHETANSREPVELPIDHD